MVEDNFVSLFVQEEKIFQTTPEWAQFNQGDRRKVQTNHEKLTQKF